MINILFVIDKYKGNYPLFNEMVRLDKSKFRVFVCYLEGVFDGKDEIGTIVEDVYYLDLSKYPKVLKTFFSIIKFREIINLNNINVINCQLEKTMFSSIVSTFFTIKKPNIVVTIHGLVGGSDNRLRKKIKNYLFFKFIKKIICVSESIKNDVIRANYGLDSCKVVSVQNGLSYDKFVSPLSSSESRLKILPDCTKPFWFGTVGRLAEKKNISNLLVAMSQVVGFRQDCALLIAGAGPLENSLKDMVKNLKINDFVYFLGNRSDVPTVLKSFDVFLFPTFREGLPLALLEAMSVGLPVIASDIAVNKEVFGDTEMGALASPNDPSEISSAMLKLMSLPSEDLIKMGENARQRALIDFSSERMIKAYEAVYQALFSSVCV